LFNINFNHSFNQTSIFSNQPQLKVPFIKQLFSNHNHNSYRNTKHIKELVILIDRMEERNLHQSVKLELEENA